MENSIEKCTIAGKYLTRQDFYPPKVSIHLAQECHQLFKVKNRFDAAN
ncbi:MAG: hypothetical protein ABIS01_05450 [Ferruginibacter sp.]